MIIISRFNGYSHDGIRRYYKGGGGGSGEARRLEEQRQAQVRAAVDAINKIFDAAPYTVVDTDSLATSYDPSKTYYKADGTIFTPPEGLQQQTASTTQKGAQEVATKSAKEEEGGSLRALKASKGGEEEPIPNLYERLKIITPKTREDLYKEQEDVVYGLNAKAVKEQYADAERANRFGLARNGLLGGSSDIESNARLQERNNEGLIQARALGQQAASDLRTADEQARQNLISMAQAGIDTGTAQQMAISQLNANAQTALGRRGGATIGNLFDDLSQAYLNRQLVNATTNGLNFGNNVYNLSTGSRGDQGSIYKR